MTTIKDVRDAMRPLIQRRNDLISTGRFVFIKPVQHLLRGVYIGSSIDPSVSRSENFSAIACPENGIS